MLLLLLFVVTMAFCGGAYWFVQRTFLTRDTARIHSRLTDDGLTGKPAAAERSQLFNAEKNQSPSMIAAVLEKLNIDARLQYMIEQAGASWAPGQVSIACILLGLVAFNTLWYFVPLLNLAVMFAAGAAAATLPILYLKRLRKKRIAAFEAQFPDSLQFMSRAMRAGHAFSVSLEMLHQEFDDPLGGEFRRAFEEQNLGLPIDVVLQKLSQRMPLMDVQFFVAAVILQKRTGGNLAEILEKLAELIRERFKLRGQIKTISAHGKLSSAVLTCIPMGVGILMYLVNPEHMMFFVEHDMGQWMAGLALGFQVLGYLIMRQSNQTPKTHTNMLSFSELSFGHEWPQPAM